MTWMLLKCECQRLAHNSLAHIIVRFSTAEFQISLLEVQPLVHRVPANLVSGLIACAQHPHQPQLGIPDHALKALSQTAF